MLIQSLKDLKTSNLAVKMLIFGQSGVGKTTLAKTIGEPTLVISAESGLLSIAGADNIDIIDISLDDKGSPASKEKRIENLQNVYKLLLSEESKKKWKWIFIDSLTEISQNIVEKLQLEYTEAKDTIKLYGENAKMMRSLIKSFRDLPHYNVVFTALSEDDKDEMGRRFIGVSMVGKMSQQIAGYLDEVFYMFAKQNDKGEVERFLLTAPSQGVVAKDRSGKLSTLEKPNLAEIAKKIRG